MRIKLGKLSIELIDLAAYLCYIGIFYKFFIGARYSLSAGPFNFRYDILSFIMPIVFFFALLDMIKTTKLPSILVVSFFYGLYAVLVTFVNQNYTIKSLPFVIINMSYWIVVFYVFYMYHLKHSESIWYNNCTIILCVVCFAGFAISNLNAQQDSAMSDRDLLMNSVYYLLCLLPAVLIHPNRLIRIGACSLVGIGVVFSGKRGALIAFALALVYIAYVSSKRSRNALKTMLGFALWIILIFVFWQFFVFFVQKYDLPILERMNMLISGEDSGSGRMEIWTDTLNTISNEDFIVNLLGRGYRAVSVNADYVNISEAHNDFLQVLFDFGIIGFLGYATICGMLLLLGSKMRKRAFRYKAQFNVSLILFLFLSMISQLVIYPYWFLGLSSFWGVMLAKFLNSENEEK